MSCLNGSTSPTQERARTIMGDPYSSLEDPEDPSVEFWKFEQDSRLQHYLSSLSDFNRLKRAVRSRLDVDRVDQVGRVGDCYYYRRRKRGEQQASLYTMRVGEMNERLLISPSSFGKEAAIAIHRVSSDGATLAFELRRGGEHSKEIRFVDVPTGECHPAFLESGLARGVVLDSSRLGAYYCHEPATAELAPTHSIHFRKFGALSSCDTTDLSVPRSKSSKLVLRQCGEALVALLYKTGDLGLLVDWYFANPGKSPVWKKSWDDAPAYIVPLNSDSCSAALLRPEKSNSSIVAIDPHTAEIGMTIVPAWEAPIYDCLPCNDRVFVSYVLGSRTVIRMWSLDGSYLGDLPTNPDECWTLLPALSSSSQEIFLEKESVSDSPEIYKYHIGTKQLTRWSLRWQRHDARRTTVEQRDFVARDGTRIQATLISSRRTKSLSNRNVIMTAYGSSGMILRPRFSVFVSIMLDLGFIFVLPRIRGGGERGKAWHQAAQGRNKVVAVDDFIDAAEWLIESGITSPAKLAIFGGSFSGLLVAAALVRRPEIFGAVLCIAPLLDMLRYHLFDRAVGWASEFGIASDPGDFRALLAYSPYHNVRQGLNYPSVLFVTGDQDSRCNPAHVRKMSALLQRRAAQTRPVLVDHRVARGHAATLPLDMRIDAVAIRIAFLCHELRVPIKHEELS